jgi:hypothetical protein
MNLIFVSYYDARLCLRPTEPLIKGQKDFYSNIFEALTKMSGIFAGS